MKRIREVLSWLNEANEVATDCMVRVLSGFVRRAWLPAALALAIGGVVVGVRASRNSAGTYSIPNTFVSGTVASSTAMNTNFLDVQTALTDSLDRNGKGGMLAPVRTADGTSTSPSYSFTSETSGGLYRSAAGDHRYAFNGTDALKLQSTAVSPLVPLRAAAGLVSAPSLSFAAETNTGWYRNAAGDIRFAVSGADKQFLSATGLGAGAAAVTLLDAQGVMASAGSIAQIRAKGISDHGYVGVDTDTPVTKDAGFRIHKGGTFKWAIYTPANTNDLRFNDGTTDRVTIANGGVVTIGTGVAVDGAGFKHQSVAGCTTAAAVGATCSSTLTWTTAFADASYHVACGCNGSTGVPVVTSYTGVAASVGITTAALTAVAATCTNIACIAVHN